MHTFVEIVPSDPVKYELDKASGHPVDRSPAALFEPAAGAVRLRAADLLRFARRGALSRAHRADAVTMGDGDPIDICVLTEKTVSHGNFLARVEPIGGLRLIDGDQADDKIIAVLSF